MSESPSFVRLSKCSIDYVRTTFCLPIHPSVVTWVVPTFLAVVKNAAVNVAANNLLESLLSVHLDVHPEVESLDHMVTW